MEMSGEQLIPATQRQTWDALNDPEILKACVPGCESIEKSGDNEYVVRMTARIGPVSAKFKGKLILSDIKPPTSYALTFEGQGGPAGFAKGGAQVRLASEGNATKLSYDVKASVGGKLAQIGSRLVDAAAKKLAEDFFNAFNAKVASQHPDHGTPAHADEHSAHDEAHPEPVADDPDKPKVDDATLRWLAAGSLVVLTVSLFVLF